MGVQKETGRTEYDRWGSRQDIGKEGKEEKEGKWKEEGDREEEIAKRRERALLYKNGYSPLTLTHDIHTIPLPYRMHTLPYFHPGCQHGGQLLLQTGKTMVANGITRAIHVSVPFILPACGNPSLPDGHFSAQSYLHFGPIRLHHSLRA